MDEEQKSFMTAPPLENWESELKRVLSMNPEELSEPDLRILFGRVGYLSDEERKRFKPVLKVSKMTKQEKKRYDFLLLTDRYFENDVKEN